MLVFRRLIALGSTIVALLAGAGAASAGMGQPSPWQLGFQQSASEVMERITSFHDYLLLWITAITAFVLLLLVIVMVRFNARTNPNPSRTTHNTLIEVLWTVVPIGILMAIAVPSFKLLFLQLNLPPADLTVKATGKQWYWSYSYPDHGKFEFDSLMLQDAERRKLQPEPPRLLAVDNEMVVPVNKNVRVITTGADVIHAFAVPAFGIKIDSIPGTNQRDLVQGDPGRRLLRPVLGAVRQGSCLHADRGARGERGRLRRLGGRRQEEIRPRRDGTADQRGGGAIVGPMRPRSA